MELPSKPDLSDISEKKHFIHRNSEVWFLTSELESERASSFRQDRWCRIFLSLGANLRIFNLRGAFDHSDAICNNIDALENFRRAGIAKYRGPKTSVREGVFVKLLRGMKHYFLADLYLPNIFKLYNKLNQLLSERRLPVVVMASSPPFSVALVGALIKRRYPSKVILTIDMRDAWALHTSLGGFKPIKRMIEKYVLSIADSVTTVSHGLADEFKASYGLTVGVMYNVATHYLDSPNPQSVNPCDIVPEIDPHRLTLIYTGSAPEKFYDVQAIMYAFSRLHREHSALARKLQFIFVGACEPVRREALRRNLTEPDIVFIPHLPQSKARSLQASASALIFLAYDGPKNMGVVSTKIFEYLCLGKPILPFDLYDGSDVDILLKRYCGSSINAHGEEDIYQLLKNIASEGVNALPRAVDVERVRELVQDYFCHAEKLLNS